MKVLHSFILISFLSISSSLYSQFTDQVNSNRPGKSAGAFAVGKKVLQIESGVYYIKESHSLLDYDAKGFGLDLTARYGVWKEQFEVTLDAQFQMDKYSSLFVDKNRSGLRNTTLGAKYLFYDPFKKGEEKPNIYSWKANHRFRWKQLIPAISGYVGANYTMENDYSIPGEAVLSPKVMAIAQNRFGSRWVLVTNLIADKIGSEAQNFGYILTLTCGVDDRWSAFLENRGVKGDYYSDGFFAVGATHLLRDNLQIDINIAKNIKYTPSIFYGGIGFSWRFDKKHKDIKIKDGKEVKEGGDEKDGEGGGGKSNIKTPEELEKAAKKAERKKRRNKDNDVEPSSDDTEQETKEEPKRKRLDELEETP